ncbi:MAG: hypothetical protein KA765_04180, partial [Thermoflexales bacterium]|nr:hypothetical protein [Thermoflexales bacterium]
MNRLWVRLTVAFVVVAVFGIGVAAVVASLSIDREFRTFVAQNEMDLQNSGLPEELIAYYQQHQTWTGLDGVVSQIGRKVFADRRADNQGGPQGDRGPGRLELVVADASGQI